MNSNSTPGPAFTPNNQRRQGRSAHKMGGIRHPKKRAFLTAYAQTGNISAAALAAGCHRNNHYLWMQKDPAYSAQFLSAHEEAIERLEAEARRRAIGGSDVLLIFLLKAMRPSVYRENFVRAGQVVLTTSPPERVLSQEEVLAGYAASVAAPAPLPKRDNADANQNGDSSSNKPTTS